jgi:hypothetical protein
MALRLDAERGREIALLVGVQDVDDVAVQQRAPGDSFLNLPVEAATGSTDARRRCRCLRGLDDMSRAPTFMIRSSRRRASAESIRLVSADGSRCYPGPVRSSQARGLNAGGAEARTGTSHQKTPGQRLLAARRAVLPRISLPECEAWEPYGPSWR